MAHFTDYLSAELAHINKVNNNNDPLERDGPDMYKTLILKSLAGNYDDLEDFINIQTALTRVLELNHENIKQLIRAKNPDFLIP